MAHTLAAPAAPATAARSDSRAAALARALGIAALAAAVCVYVYLMFYHDQLVGLDLAQLTAGRLVPMPILPSSGRFFPLAFQEYNTLNLVGRTAAVYHAFSLVELAVLLSCVRRLCAAQPRWLRAAAIAFMLVMPSFVYAFFGIVYPERDILFWMAIWLTSIRTFENTNNRTALAGAIAAATLSLYYKETMFLLVGGFAATRLALRLRVDPPRPERRSLGDFARRNAVELALLASCAVFLAIYLLRIAPRIQTSYSVNTDTMSNAFDALRSYVASDLVFDALVVLLAARVVRAVALGARLDPLWDAAAVGAVLYAAAYIKLGLVRDHYFAPVDFIGVLYVVNTGASFVTRERRMLAGATLVLITVACARNVSQSASYIAARREYTAASARLTGALGAYARAHPGQRVMLFFPQIGGFQIMEFSAYLRYRGLSLEGAEDEHQTAQATFTVTTPHRFPGDRCHVSQYFKCAYAPVARPNALVVLMPGHDVSDSEIARIGAHATRLFRDDAPPTRTERILDALASATRQTDRPAESYVFKY
jgi:hypothetical protein